MRTIERTTQFKRDYKREMKGRHRTTLPTDLTAVIADLAADRPLAPRLRDHALTGNWHDHRDCHVKPDLVLIYRLVGTETLQLVRLGSHAGLGF
ncbi:type II toxin-antitoxin system YafQ family toxin [Methylorubrum sp. SB2]|uniref:type II toxin-antitoxin system YafQ family toxin n=1 Tax=Methylorubrum subtropicum TaxID=3138812 RepID=UPI00313F04B0